MDIGDHTVAVYQRAGFELTDGTICVMLVSVCNSESDISKFGWNF